MFPFNTPEYRDTVTEAGTFAALTTVFLAMLVALTGILTVWTGIVLAVWGIAWAVGLAQPVVFTTAVGIAAIIGIIVFVALGLRK